MSAPKPTDIEVQEVTEDLAKRFADPPGCAGPCSTCSSAGSSSTAASATTADTSSGPPPGFPRGIKHHTKQEEDADA